MDWKKEKRKETYILFSISGYTEELQEIAKKRNDLILVDNI